MNSTEIKRYKNKSIPQLIKIAERYFNKYIRKRDAKKGCISCGGPVENAGHYLSAGHNAHVRFDERNVHGQCISCNKWRHGNLIEYRKGLVRRLGLQYVEMLEGMSREWKWDRFYLIHIIESYKAKSL